MYIWNMRKIKFLIAFIFISLGKSSFSAIVYDTLYLLQNSLSTGAYTIQTRIFASSLTDTTNAIIELDEGDVLQLHVVNLDTLEHTFTIDGIVENNNLLNPNGGGDFTITFTEKGPYRYYSDKFYGKSLGASGIIMYGYENHARFYWNLFEQSTPLTQDIASLNQMSIPIDYQPDIFSINMKVHPDLNFDAKAKVTGNVGDTIYITILNSGNMEHPFHFHGYHVKILKASQNTKYTNWIKDSFGIAKGEIMLLELIPNQPGIFPVHNHNLITITTNGVYPGGMLNIIEIQP